MFEFLQTFFILLFDEGRIKMLSGYDIQDGKIIVANIASHTFNDNLC